MKTPKRKIDIWEFIGKEPTPPRTSWPSTSFKPNPPKETEADKELRYWNRQHVHNPLNRQQIDDELEDLVDRGLRVGGFWEPKSVYDFQVLKSAIEIVSKSLTK